MITSYSVTPEVFIFQKTLHYKIFLPSAHSLIEHLTVIKLFIKKVQLFFSRNQIYQKSVNSNEMHITVKITNIIIYEGLYLNMAQKSRFNKLLELARKISKYYNPPRIHLIYKYIIGVIH